MAAHLPNSTCLFPLGIYKRPPSAIVTQVSACRPSRATAGTATSTLCLAVATASEHLGAVLQGIQDQRQRQEHDMAHCKQEIEQLQVLLLLGQVPCPASVGRQASHAVASTGASTVGTTRNIFKAVKLASAPDYEVSLGSQQCAGQAGRHESTMHIAK